jgi:hypothetical protein
MGKKKQGRKTNKKKGGGGGGARRPNNGGSNVNVASHSGNINPSSLLQGEIPDFGDNTDVNPIAKGNFSTIYTRYKAATRRFLEYMRDSVPKEEIKDDKSCNFLLTAADWMSANSHVMDPNIMKDLKLCIRIRNRVAKSVFGGGDVGHKYFLEVLVYCWTVLRLLPVAEKDADAVDRDEENEEVDANRFLLLDDGEEDDELEEDDNECFPLEVSRPQTVENPVTIEELLASDDRNDAILFLHTLDEFMDVIAGQFATLARSFRSCRRMGHDTAVVSNLLDGAITSNFAIQSVQKLEMELQAQHEHLSTPCRLLATLVFPELTAHVHAVVQEHGTKRCDRTEVIAFIGDCMMCSAFLNPSDEWNKKDSIVGDFCDKYGLDSTGHVEIEQAYAGIRHMTILEIPMKHEMNDLNRMRTVLEEETGKPHNSHSWLPHLKFIGRDRSIHHTVRLLQLFAGAIDNCALDKTLGPARQKGMFGKLCNNPSNFRDMDEFLMSHLLPNWTNMCRFGIMGKVCLPHSSELFPLFLQLKGYVDNPRRAVSWSCAFAVHALLTGILEVNTERQQIATISKGVFSRYFDSVRHQMKSLSNEKSSSMSKSSAFQNIMMVSFLENFGLPAFEESAMWNPLCAGTNLTILDYFGNIEGGMAVIDCQAQLRIILYLYHGLLINGIIEEDDMPLLRYLYKGFKNCKALWHGALPRRGELVKKFWISFGMGLTESRQMSESARLLAQGGPVHPGGVFAEGIRHGRGRKMKPIEPSEILTSFRRICDRDFSDVVDKYHTPEQRQRSKDTENYHVAVRTNDTLDHLEDELVFHSVNLLTTAHLLEQYICSITRVLQWDSLIEIFHQSTNLDRRLGFAILFAQHLLGALDFANNPLRHRFTNAPMLTKCAPDLIMGVTSFLVEFFRRVSPTQVLWFQASESDEGAPVELVGSGSRSNRR